METITPVERTLTQSDHLRLTRLLAQQRHQLPGVEALRDMLDTSDVVASRAVPSSVVTMHSRVLLEDPVRGGMPFQLTVCYPEEADPAAGAISVLSPVGAALLGLCVGETARWSTPGGEGAARILSVLFQPENGGEGAA
ncbi:GreA/GreB family elongation factor [Ramlibacter pallidus]|uniref:GreA/GreB family elongation factor n=1 Tax=Ramlibacter pallidus TaxID=2780087 RepID=A0ABR9S5I8_9BURK|nr:GreA/GreB family elongation factor [Ramlibacter pallidus]MBE7368775.1 GreA/GreB family elongation factor [Ramlibacter pallidus]